MKSVFKPGAEKVHKTTIGQNDVAAFKGETVHRVCSTFALAREIEWATRQFVLEMREEDEEGIGTMLAIHHQSPALEGEEIIIQSRIESIEGHELICTFNAMVGDRSIATGKTGQKILKKGKLERLFAAIES